MGLSSPQLRLTSVFGMGTGVTIAMNHQNKTFDILFKSKSEIWAPQQTVVARLQGPAWARGENVLTTSKQHMSTTSGKRRREPLSTYRTAVSITRTHAGAITNIWDLSQISDFDFQGTRIIIYFKLITRNGLRFCPPNFLKLFG